MKARFKQMWIEHNSKDKKPEEVIENDTAKALEKINSTLSKSLDPKLTGQKEKITLAKEKAEKIILKNQQKKKDIEHLTKQISQKKLLIKDSSNTKGLASQSKEERYKKLGNEILTLEREVQKLKTPQPLKPLEMVDVLGFLTEYSTLGMESDWSKVIDSLSVKMPTTNLIYISDNFVNKIFINYIKKEIVLRKSFLQESAQNLSIVTKLPDKVGDLDNILGVVKNLQEFSKNVFTCDQEFYSSQIDALAEPLQLLLKVRGKLKIWLDVDKFVQQHKITDGSLVKMVKKAKSPDGGGIFNFLGGQEINNLAELLDKVEPLTKGYWLFYKAFIHKDGQDFLLSRLTAFRESLIQQIKIGFESFIIKSPRSDEQASSNGTSNPIIKIGEKCFQNLQQKSLRDIISVFLKDQDQLILIVLDYFDDNTAFRLHNHYKKQLDCTNLAIKILSTRTYKDIPIEKSETVSFYPNWLEASFLNPTINFLNNYFQEATDHLGRNKIINIILGYVIEKDITDTELSYLSDLAHYNLEEKLLFLQLTKKILNFCHECFSDDHVEILKKNLQFLEPIEIETHASEVLKIIDIKNSPLTIILRIIDLIVDTVKFFGFDNIQKLNSSGKSVKKEIEKIEKHLSEQVGPNIKSLVTTAFNQENELLDNFSYLIDYEKHKKSHKKVSSFYLLNLLINLSKYAKFCPEKLLTQKNLNKIITLNQDSIIEAINKINDTEPYGGHMRLSDLSMVFDRNTKTSVLFELVGLGCITKEIINKFLAEKVDINAEHNRETLLSLITYQLTKVGRKTDFSPIPRKYTVDPEKQEQLIDIALYLIQKKANINSESHKTGFLPILFSIIPSEQSPYIYKKLLSDKEVISQLNLQEVDPLGRNLAHLFCKDIGEFFHSSTDPEAAKIEICTILTRIIASKNTYHLNNQDRLGNTPWHYLASSITTEYVNIKTDHSFSQLKNQIGLNIKNGDGDTPLHTAFNQKADPAAFYKFVLTDIYPPTQWLKCPRLGLKIKNNQKQTVLDMIIHTKNKLAASIINVYMAVVNYKIDLDDDYTFENIHSKVNSFLKSIGKVTIDEIEQTIYLAKSYDSTQYVSSSSSSSSTPSSHLSVRFGGIKSNGEIISLGGSDTSTLASSSLSSSSSSSISHSFSSSFPSHPYLPIGLDMGITERELSDAHDGHTIPPLMGESDDFTLHV